MSAIQIYRGDTPQVQVPVVDQSGAIVNVTGGTCTLTVKAQLTDTVPVMQVVGTVLNGPTGLLGFQLVAAVTALLAPGGYIYDVELRLGSNVYTVCEDAFVVLADVTN